MGLWNTMFGWIFGSEPFKGAKEQAAEIRAEIEEVKEQLIAVRNGLAIVKDKSGVDELQEINERSGAFEDNLKQLKKGWKVIKKKIEERLEAEYSTNLSNRKEEAEKEWNEIRQGIEDLAEIVTSMRDHQGDLLEYAPSLKGSTAHLESALRKLKEMTLSRGHRMRP